MKSVWAVLAGCSLIAGLGNGQDIVRESVFHVSRVDLAYEPETREELAKIFEALNASVKDRDLPVFAYVKEDRVTRTVYRISNVTNAEGQTSRATVYADLSRLLEVDRTLQRTIETRVGLEERAATIREDLSRASHAMDNDLPFATGDSGAKLDERQVKRLEAELAKIDAKLVKFTDAPPTAIESILIPMGFYGDGDEKARLVAAMGLSQKVDEELFIASLKAGFSYTVEWTEDEPVGKEWGNPEIGQNPDEKYFPKEYPRGFRPVRYRVEVIW